jgi:ADP-dependent NAD(P)H-hydrate dehydratase / NAD(P)H-hydrate epimerase
MDNRTALLTVDQMSRADALTVSSGLPAAELMDNAGSAVAEEIIKGWPMQPIIVLCGTGNNGGDGFVVARKLKLAGWPVRVALLGSLKDLKNESSEHARRWNGPIEVLNPQALEDATIVVDAILGAGLNRVFNGVAKQTLLAAIDKKLTIVAIDVPSGIMGDSGEDLGAVQANLTVTFFKKKPGHLLLPGRNLCGLTVVKDIGISPDVFSKITPKTFENHPCLWKSKLPSLSTSNNKYQRGHALVYGGYPMTGASRLASHACARMGAGLTTIAALEIAHAIYSVGLMSIMVKPLAHLAAIDELMIDPRFSSFLVGPGAGVGNETKRIAQKMLATGKPTVIDADAITSFKEQPMQLFDSIINACILTPHEGEFSRLFTKSGSKLVRARDAAAQSGAIVILKGADTVIVSPDGTAVINSNAPATLATAGSGDVLSGMVLGLLSQGMLPFQACCAAVWMHGEAANLFGTGLIADDLPDLLPRVSATLFATS